ncbi:MAG TPA: ATP-binding cassette domain-containing protein [Sphaerochaeta sp.]|nr:ATP-binding cassette domain-containing protein [Sphaerochaeta sp.]
MKNLQIQNISKRYGPTVVFNKFSCTLHQGEVNVLFGASGSGKTTLLRLLMGLEEADEGSLHSFEDLRFSAVFQEDRLCNNLSAFSNVKLVVAPSVSSEQIRKALVDVGLGDAIRKPAKELSGGMRRRVALIRALMAPYDLIVLDEPFKGLDEVMKQQVIAYTKQATKAKTVILVTHDHEEAKLIGAKHIINLETIAACEAISSYCPR